MRIKSMSQPPVYRDLEEEIEETRRAKEAAIEAQEFEKAANLRDTERQLTNRKRELEDQWDSGEGGERPEVGEEEIADIVSMWTGIPVFKLTEAETKKLMRMEDELHKRVIGQHVAIEAVSKAIRRSRAGIKDPKRPAGSFIFLGPSGVGKTELARTLAEFLFGDEDAMVRIDMSEYMEKHAVSRLVGSPPGYVGYDEGGQLTEAVRRKPYSVLLLDEIEKAHPDVFNILLQILEDGRLTDAQGRTVDFRNTIVIMTSNIGAKDIARNVSFGFGSSDDETGTSYEEMKDRIMGELKKVFRPEFLNRIDEVIVFHKLTRDEIKEIIDLLISRVRAQVAEHELQLELDRRGQGPAGREGLGPGDGRPAAAPRDPALHRGPARRRGAAPRPDSIVPGTTVVVDRDESGDEEERPLRLKMVKPRKPSGEEEGRAQGAGRRRREEVGRRLGRDARRAVGRRRARRRRVGLGHSARPPSRPGFRTARWIALERWIVSAWETQSTAEQLHGDAPGFGRSGRDCFDPERWGFRHSRSLMRRRARVGWADRPITDILLLPGVWPRVADLVGALRRLRRVEHAGRGAARPSRPRPPGRRRRSPGDRRGKPIAAARRLGPGGRPPAHRDRRARPGARRRPRARVAGPARRLARDRQVDADRDGARQPRRRRAHACSTSPVRSRPPRCGCAPSGSATPRSRCRCSPRPRSRRCSRRSRPSAPMPA